MLQPVQLQRPVDDGLADQRVQQVVTEPALPRPAAVQRARVAQVPGRRQLVHRVGARSGRVDGGRRATVNGPVRGTVVAHAFRRARRTAASSSYSSATTARSITPATSVSAARSVRSSDVACVLASQSARRSTIGAHDGRVPKWPVYVCAAASAHVCTANARLPGPRRPVE